MEKDEYDEFHIEICEKCKIYNQHINNRPDNGELGVYSKLHIALVKDQVTSFYSFLWIRLSSFLREDP